MRREGFTLKNVNKNGLNYFEAKFCFIPLKLRDLTILLTYRYSHCNRRNAIYWKSFSNHECSMNCINWPGYSPTHKRTVASLIGRKQKFVHLDWRFVNYGAYCTATKYLPYDQYLASTTYYRVAGVPTPS